MFLLTAQTVKNSQILNVIYFIFLKKTLGQNRKAFNVKFGPH